MVVNVGAIILASGVEPFDPKVMEQYKYGRFENVVTSMDYERLMCATGPYQGEVLRGSDQKHPHKVAWVQCVGSRQVTPGANSYCSAVCCTYTQKQVILTKEHDAETECTVFHNDIRSFGKDFERYYQRAESLPGVRFIRSYVSIEREDPVTKNVTIRYATTDEGVKEEEFDMVVLSVGLNPPADVQGLADTFGIELNEHGFSRTDPVESHGDEPARGLRERRPSRGRPISPSRSSRPARRAPRSASCSDYRRGKLAEERVYPAREGRLAGGAADRRLRVPLRGQHRPDRGGALHGGVRPVRCPTSSTPTEQLFSCATNSAKEITDTVKEQGLNRVVIAACSPRTLEPLFRDTLREAGLNQYYLEMANIREHCSWVHAKEKEEATEKAKDIIRMSVARARQLEPLQEFDLPVNKAALVVGGGVAGMTSALSIANQGHDVHLVEREADLGGWRGGSTTPSRAWTSRRTWRT